MRFPYHNRTEDVPVTNADGAVYAYELVSWRLTTTGTILQRVVRHYLCGKTHEITYRTEPFDVPAADVDHREAVFGILRRMADLARFDRQHREHPACTDDCHGMRHNEPAALHPRPVRRRRRMRQVGFAWAESA